jgi:hypothetical protein
MLLCCNLFYLKLCTFSFEINESRLSDTRCCITTMVIKRMVRLLGVRSFCYYPYSIKTRFKQITKVKLKCAQYSEGYYILCMKLCTFSFEINESRLSDTRCCITTMVIKRMARRCTRRSEYLLYSQGYYGFHSFPVVD